VIESAMEVTNPRPGATVVALKGEHDVASADETNKLFSELIANTPVPKERSFAYRWGRCRASAARSS
jgi:hypothetical protein